MDSFHLTARLDGQAFDITYIEPNTLMIWRDHQILDQRKDIFVAMLDIVELVERAVRK